MSALRYICECVSRRAGLSQKISQREQFHKAADKLPGFMCAAGITALLKKMDYRSSLLQMSPIIQGKSSKKTFFLRSGFFDDFPKLTIEKL